MGYGQARGCPTLQGNHRLSRLERPWGTQANRVRAVETQRDHEHEYSLQSNGLFKNTQQLLTVVPVFPYKALPSLPAASSEKETLRHHFPHVDSAMKAAENNFTADGYTR